jgi:hypothetical protein
VDKLLDEAGMRPIVPQTTLSAGTVAPFELLIERMNVDPEIVQSDTLPSTGYWTLSPRQYGIYTIIPDGTNGHSSKSRYVPRDAYLHQRG